MPSIAVSTAYALSFANDRSVGVARARGLGKTWVHKRLRFSLNVEGSGRLTTRSLQKRRSLDIEEDVPGQNGFLIPARSHLLQVAVDIDEGLIKFSPDSFCAEKNYLLIKGMANYFKWTVVGKIYVSIGCLELFKRGHDSCIWRMSTDPIPA